LAGFDIVTIKDPTTGRTVTREPAKGDKLVKADGVNIHGYSLKRALASVGGVQGTEAIFEFQKPTSGTGNTRRWR